MSSPSEFTLDPSLFNQDLYVSILRLWLPTYPNPSSQFTQNDLIRWFTLSKYLDDQIRNLAGNALASLSPDHLALPPFTTLEADQELYDEIAAPFTSQLSVSEDTTTTDGIPAAAHAALALAVLLDQFPRNIHRGSSQSVVYTHYDRLSRALNHHIRLRGLDASPCFADAPVWRIWFYLPLEHSERVADHERYCSVLEEMLGHAKDMGDEIGVRFVEKAIGVEQRHLKPLKEFGRFPWRSKWVGRESTQAERMWLEEGGDRFGTG
ncbi:MAG: hypothetical protein Q9160_008625 [Pyrenula sp. 1 TL-2023]